MTTGKTAEEEKRPNINAQKKERGAAMSAAPQACAACKYQRRKCAPNCLLAPYFPPDAHRHFLNVHRLFGVSNVLKIIRSLADPSHRDIAMRSLIFQANVRATDPAGGCYRVICELQRQIALANAELDFVVHHLTLCRAAQSPAAAAPDSPPPHILSIPATNNDPHLVELPSSPLLIAHTGSSNLFDHFDPIKKKGENVGDSTDQDPVVVDYQWPGLHANSSFSSTDPDVQAKRSPFLEDDNDDDGGGGSGGGGGDGDGEDIKPLLASFGDMKPLAGSTGCSGKVVVKQEVDSIFHEPHDLKGAASLFCITNFTHNN